MVAFGALEGQGSPLPSRASNRLEWQRLCWAQAAPPVSMGPSVLGETDGAEGHGPELLQGVPASSGQDSHSCPVHSSDCLPGCPVIHVLSHVAKAQRSLVRCQINEVFLSKCQPAPGSGRQPVMSQGRADKPVVWSETVPSIVPLQA